MKARIPWQSKIAAKVVLSRLPVGYRFWQRVGLFRCGPMDQPEYAYRVFCRHLGALPAARRTGGFVTLELGPGDTLFSALIAPALGASGSILVDMAPFARNEMELYQGMASYLWEKGLSTPDMANVHSLDELLATCGAQYLTAGLSSLRSIPDRSVDLIWSQAVLEHIRKAEFLDTMHELRRIVRHDGVCSHEVDLKDHLGGALNHLRFSEAVWESDFMASSGFYTNRIRYSEMLDLFRQAGFEAKVTRVVNWDHLPTPRTRLAPGFGHLADDELCISEFDVTLYPA